MERARQAEMKRQFQMVAKAALVNNVKVKFLKKNFSVKKNLFLGIKKT
jgi:hypothetical protein